MVIQAAPDPRMYFRCKTCGASDLTAVAADFPSPLSHTQPWSIPTVVCPTYLDPTSWHRVIEVETPPAVNL